MVRLAQRISARRDDADGLALQHRKRHAAEVQHHVVRLAFKARLSAVEVADHSGGSGAFGREQVGVRVRG
ncbi:hypothetical protein D3C72_2348480 [compost metagenome]